MTAANENLMVLEMDDDDEYPGKIGTEILDYPNLADALIDNDLEERNFHLAQLILDGNVNTPEFVEAAKALTLAVVKNREQSRAAALEFGARHYADGQVTKPELQALSDIRRMLSSKATFETAEKIGVGDMVRESIKTLFPEFDFKSAGQTTVWSVLNKFEDAVLARAAAKKKASQP